MFSLRLLLLCERLTRGILNDARCQGLLILTSNLLSFGIFPSRRLFHHCCGLCLFVVSFRPSRLGLLETSRSVQYFRGLVLLVLSLTLQVGITRPFQLSLDDFQCVTHFSHDFVNLFIERNFGGFVVVLFSRK